jgi:hypothetical protein
MEIAKLLATVFLAVQAAEQIQFIELLGEGSYAVCAAQVFFLYLDTGSCGSVQDSCHLQVVERLECP